MPSVTEETVVVRDPATTQSKSGDRTRSDAETPVFSIAYRAELRDFIALHQILRRVGPLGRFAGVAFFFAGPFLVLCAFLLAYPWMDNPSPSGFAAYADVSTYRDAFATIHAYRRQVGIGLGLYAFIYMSYSAAFFWAVWRNASGGEAVTLTLSASGVESIMGETVSRTAWADIAFVIPHGPYLFLLPSRRAGYAVPRRAAASEAEFSAWTAYANMRANQTRR